jgi:hypothetical protein
MIWPFDTEPYVKRGYCGNWSRELFWTTTSSDLLIGISFIGVGALILYILYKRRDIPVRWLTGTLAATTIACGVTHLTGTLMSLWPAQWVDALMRAATGVLCLATFFGLCFSLRRIVLLITPLLTEQSELTSDVSVLVEGLDKQRETINEKTRDVLAQVRMRLARIGAIRKELSQVGGEGEAMSNDTSE